MKVKRYLIPILFVLTTTISVQINQTVAIYFETRKGFINLID